VSAVTENLTTRNQLQGTVKRIVTGSVMAEVSVEANDTELVAAVTRHSVERLDLHEGDTVTVLVKATEVMLAKGTERLDTLTTRNQIPGKVTHVESGTVMAEVQVDAGAAQFVAAITRNSVDRLGLSAGDDVVVLVKATEVMLAKS
jgi:molybdate transport system regulatory protein